MPATGQKVRSLRITIKSAVVRSILDVSEQWMGRVKVTGITLTKCGEDNAKVVIVAHRDYVQGGTPFNIATMLATKSLECHMGERYMLNRPIVCEGETTDDVIFEMSFAHGYRGPRPTARLTRWAASRGYNRVEFLWLPKIAGLKANEKFHDALCDAGKGPNWDGVTEPVGITPYAKMQLLLQLAHERRGIPIPDMPKRTTCSEMTSRRVFPEYDMREEDGHGGHESHDSVSPGSGWKRIVAQVAAA